MATETLDVETPAAGVLLVRLNRPNRLNAINEVMRDEIALTLASVAQDARSACGGAHRRRPRVLFGYRHP